MLKKTGFGFALGISAFLLAGCGGNGEPKEKPNGIGANVDKKDAAPPEKKVVRASPQTITLYVPEMQKRGGYEGAELTWVTWPNKVKEALVGLPGVEAVTVDLDNELLEVRFDSSKMAATTLLHAVDKLGFQAKIK